MIDKTLTREAFDLIAKVKKQVTELENRIDALLKKMEIGGPGRSNKR